MLWSVFVCGVHGREGERQKERDRNEEEERDKWTDKVCVSLMRRRFEFTCC